MSSSDKEGGSHSSPPPKFSLNHAIGRMAEITLLCGYAAVFVVHSSMYDGGAKTFASHSAPRMILIRLQPPSDRHNRTRRIDIRDGITLFTNIPGVPSLVFLYLRVSRFYPMTALKMYLTDPLVRKFNDYSKLEHWASTLLNKEPLQVSVVALYLTTGVK
jgi:hypothetical protein